MWKDLTYKERAELINRWNKEHVLDYASKIAEYDRSFANKFDGGGDTNPMHYEHVGTIFSDELKNQGITHTAELPEVKVTGRNPNSYRSSYDPLALYSYGVKPALEGAGKVMSAALHPIDNTVDALTSPAWWVNKAITGNSDNAVQRFRDWAHTATRDAGMLLSPTRTLGTLRTGFEYAPWNPDNPGITDNSEMGNAVNNTLDLLLSSLAPKATVESANMAIKSQRARDALYNNITPWSYRDSARLGTYYINKGNEIKGTVKDFLTPGKIDTSYPKWKRRYDEHLAQHPEERTTYNMYDDDTIFTPAIMEMRDQAWAKAMRQPDSPRWQRNIYKDNGDGTWSYDLDAVDEIRRTHGGGEFSGLPSGNGSGGFADNITTNGGGVNITEYPNGYYRMQDVWDLHPLPELIKKYFSDVSNPYIKKGLDKASEIDLVKFFGGDPFKLDMLWDSNDPRFFMEVE